VKLRLVQPSLRREWHLVRGDDVVATLWVQLFRRAGTADVAGKRLRIEREGRLRTEYVVREEPRFRQRTLELADRRLAWKHLGRGEGYGFVGPDDEPLVRAKIASGIARTNGEVEVADGLPEQEAILAALMACILLIRKAEDVAAASASTGAVA
jgi:hypothetical protein